MKKTIFSFVFCLCVTFAFAQKTTIVAGISAAYQALNYHAYGHNRIESDRSTGFSLGYQLGKYVEFGGTIAVHAKKGYSIFDDKTNGYSKEKTILHTFGGYVRGYYPLTKSINLFVQPTATRVRGRNISDASRTYIDGHQETTIEGKGFQLQPGVQFKIGNALRIEILMSGSAFSNLNYALTTSTNQNYPIGAKHGETNLDHNYSFNGLQLGVRWQF